jgi:YD repeat-containing protein
VTRLLHGQRYSIGFYASLARPYFNPLIRRCEFDVGFAAVNLDTLDERCSAVNWLAPSVSQTGPLIEDHILIDIKHERMVLGHDRSPQGTAQLAIYSKVWGKSTTPPSYRAVPALLTVNPGSFQEVMTSINSTAVLVLASDYYRWPVPAVLFGKLPDVEAQEQAYSYPSQPSGSPDVFVWDFSYDYAVRKLITQYQHRELASTADDRRIDYAWNKPFANGYWYEKISETLYTGTGVRLAQSTRSNFFNFDMPQKVINCGVTSPGDCKTDSYAYFSNGTLQKHTLPDQTVESWTYLAWCGEPLTYVDPASRNTTYTRTSSGDTRCLLQSFARNGATFNYSYDALLRPSKVTLDPGGGTAATSTITRTFYYDDLSTYNPIVMAREDAGYVEPRRAVRRGDGQLELVYEDGLGRTTRVRQCRDNLGNTTGGDISLVACAGGTDRNVAWSLYGADGLLKISTDPFNSSETATVQGSGHDGLGRVIVAIDPVHAATSPAWDATTIVYDAGHEERIEPAANGGSRKIRYYHSTRWTSLTVDGVSRGREDLDVLGQVFRATAPDGKITELTYDGRHLLVRQELVDAFGNAILASCLTNNGVSVNRPYAHEISQRDARDRVQDRDSTRRFGRRLQLRQRRSDPDPQG